MSRVIDYLRLLKNTEGISERLHVMHGIIRASIGKLTNRACFYSDKPFFVKEDGIWFYSPANDISIVSVGLSEQNNLITAACIRELAKSDRRYFIDIGASIGAVSLPIAVKFPKINVIAIEPIPWLAEAINISARKNNIKITIHNSAVSTQSEAKLKIPKLGKTWLTTMTSNRPNFDATPRAELSYEFLEPPSKTITLDKICEGINPSDIALIKIDVEGAEADALFSGKISLKKGKPAIIFEAWGDEKLKEVKAVLEPLGYSEYEKVDDYNYIAR